MTDDDNAELAESLRLIKETLDCVLASLEDLVKSGRLTAGATTTLEDAFVRTTDARACVHWVHVRTAKDDR